MCPLPCYPTTGYDTRETPLMRKTSEDATEGVFTAELTGVVVKSFEHSRQQHNGILSPNIAELIRNELLHTLLASVALEMQDVNRTSSRQSSLPDEIWIAVWSSLPLIDRIDVARVCTLWRTIARSSHALWSSITINITGEDEEEAPYSPSKSAIHLALARGGNAPLHIQLVNPLSSHAETARATGLFQAHAPRIVELHIGRLPRAVFKAAKNFPELRVLDCNVSSATRWDPGMTERNEKKVGVNVANLRDIRASISLLHWLHSHADPDIDHSFHGLQDVDLKVTGVGQILWAFRICPALRKARFSFCKITSEEDFIPNQPEFTEEDRALVTSRAARLHTIIIQALPPQFDKNEGADDTSNAWALLELLFAQQVLSLELGYETKAKRTDEENGIPRRGLASLRAMHGNLDVAIFLGGKEVSVKVAEIDADGNAGRTRKVRFWRHPWVCDQLLPPHDHPDSIWSIISPAHIVSIKIDGQFDAVGFSNSTFPILHTFVATSHAPSHHTKKKNKKKKAPEEDGEMEESEKAAAQATLVKFLEMHKWDALFPSKPSIMVEISKGGSSARFEGIGEEMMEEFLRKAAAESVETRLSVPFTQESGDRADAAVDHDPEDSCEHI
ncbi:hypothetical protein BKA62DRAFT_54974 [Auriculariales sp. MPI-PUGE-AT-0066]|nr:hypothetical protein BKA62DRAFT_54974 [Auriculariales sp. MPI-PUGE-AT-0066]